MKLFNSKENIGQAITSLKSQGSSIGFVPTMGALHEGHSSLVGKALNENNVVVVSVFVNPTQFNNKEDLKKYPKTLKRDVALLETLSKDRIIVYAPTVEDIYKEGVLASHFDFGGLEHEMEGEFRKGHFDGVGTVVKRLLEIVRPHKVYFGEKDFQQLQIVKILIEKLKLPVEIIGCAIHRETSGLAMSSRNERLKPEYYEAAPFIFKTLKAARAKFETKSANKVTQWVKQEFAKHRLLKLEYFMIADVKTLKPSNRKSRNKEYRAFIAVHADDVRLIDNIALN